MRLLPTPLAAFNHWSEILDSIVVFVVVVIVEFPFHHVVLELHDGLTVGVEPFDAPRQTPTGHEVQMFKSVA